MVATEATFTSGGAVQFQCGNTANAGGPAVHAGTVPASVVNAGAGTTLTALWPASSGGGVVVRLRDSRELKRTYPYPPGHPKNQMTDADVERKLFDLTDGVLTNARTQQIVEAVGRFERCDRVGDVLGLCAIDA